MNSRKSNISLTENKNYPWRETLREMEKEDVDNNARDQRGNQQSYFKPGAYSGAAESQSSAKVWGESARVVNYASRSPGRNRRRRPRVGILGAANGNESNLDSLELTLQDTSKISSSTTTSTDTVSHSPGTSPNRSPGHTGETSPEIFEDELSFVHEQDDFSYTRSPKYAKVSTQEPTAYRNWPSSLSPNPSNPFAPSPNPTNPVAQSPNSTNPFSQENSGGGSTSESRLPISSRVYYNPFGDEIEESSTIQLQQPPSTERSKSPDTSHVSDASSSRGEDEQFQNRLALHRLCEESTSPGDIAWRNALYLLAMQPDLAHQVDGQGRTALHMACTGRTKGDEPPCPPPPFIIHAFFIANPGAIKQTDADGRLPLHCLAATSGDAQVLQLLVEAHPSSIFAQDAMGWIPLHLFLQNQHVHVAVPQVQILLGMTVPLEATHAPDQHNNIRQRRGDHLRLNVEHLDRMRKNQRETPLWQPMARWNISDEIVNAYPEDVQQCLRQLSRWERKRQRSEAFTPESHGNHQRNKDISFLSSASSKTSSFRERERNPAAISAPQDRRLPIHMTIVRGLTDVHLQSSRVEEPKHEIRVKKHGSSKYVSQRRPRQQHTLIVIVRMLISAYPESLITRDINGHTPLLLAMVSAADVLPSQELLELLLGKRTAGFESLPAWAHDVPYPIQHAYMPISRRRLTPAAERYCNPAIVSTLDTCQLPLHIAAEEWGEYASLLVAIYESYPGAIHVQDARGRMPLHILLQNYRRIPPHPEIVALLLTDRVGKACNDEGQIPFDLLVDAAAFLPKDPLPGQLSLIRASLREDPYKTFRHFFQPSVLESPGSGDGGRLQRNFVRRRAEAGVFLWRLRSLPSWIRRQACTISFIQELLVDEIASPAKSAFILIQGLVLVLLLVTFHRQKTLFMQTAHNQMISQSELGSSSGVFNGTGDDILNHVFVDPSTRYETWNSLTIYGLSAVHLGFQAVFWALSASLQEFQHLCLFNLWRWVDLLSILAVVVASTMIHQGLPDEHVLIVMTLATGIIWCSVVGFFATWWYGVAYFTNLIAKVVQIMIWPVLVASICVIGFAEMFHTISQVDCVSALGSAPVCSRRDTYQLVYFLVVGEPVVDIGSPGPSTGMAVLIVLFAVFLLLFVLSVIFVTVSFKSDREAIALDCAVSYWEPKLAFVISSQSSREATTRYRKGMWVPQPSRLGLLETSLEELWGFSLCLLFGVEKHHYWYATEIAPLKCLVLKVALVVILPLWLLVGLLTAGLLWPPQVRRFIFMPRVGVSDESNNSKEFLASQVAGVKNEVMNLKNMSYEHSQDIQQELHLLRGLLAGSTSSD